MVKKLDLTLLISVFGVIPERKIQGRTRIQKLICLLKFKDKLPFSFKFKSLFGPYSNDLSESINTRKHEIIRRKDR